MTLMIESSSIFMCWHTSLRPSPIYIMSASVFPILKFGMNVCIWNVLTMIRVMVLMDDIIAEGLHMMGLVMSSIYDMHVVRYWQEHNGVAKNSAAPVELSV